MKTHSLHFGEDHLGRYPILKCLVNIITPCPLLAWKAIFGTARDSYIRHLLG
uniref:Uncharacterized protein n=1 Tax=Arundo donax TaxID=35708 RepID=A0A0A8XWD3_ARUDO